MSPIDTYCPYCESGLIKKYGHKSACPTHRARASGLSALELAEIAEEASDFREYLEHIQQKVDSTLCVCGHRQDNHSRDDNIDNPDPGEPCGKCECFTFRPTFFREGEK